MKKKPREKPLIIIPKNYEIEDFLELDDNGFEYEEAVLCEEVEIIFERSIGKK